MNSNCCNAEMKVSTADEGTSCWICSKCQKACNPKKMSLKKKTKEKPCSHKYEYNDCTFCSHLDLRCIKCFEVTCTGIVGEVDDENLDHN